MENTKPPRTPQQGDKYIVRLPDGMRERIAEEAKKNNRSMNAEIVARLEGSFEAQEDARAAVTPILEKLDRLEELVRSSRQLDIFADGAPQLDLMVPPPKKKR